MDTTELGARFRKFQVGVLLGMAFIVLVNIVLSVIVISKLESLHRRLPISVSCSGSSYTVPPCDGVLEQSFLADEEAVSLGEAALVACFKFANIVPGCTVRLAYREDQATSWSYEPMSNSPLEPLGFSAAISAGFYSGLLLCRAEQMIDGQVVAVSKTHTVDPGYLLGGDGRAIVDYMVLDGGKARVVIWQPWGGPKIEGRRMESVTLRFAGPMTSSLTLTPIGPSVVHEFEAKGLVELEVTISYKDGETRSDRFTIDVLRSGIGLEIKR